MHMFTREEVTEVIAEARNYFDDYTMEHLGYLRIALASYDKHKSQAKRDEDWRKVDLEVRSLRKWLVNLRSRNIDAGGSSV